MRDLSADDHARDNHGQSDNQNISVRYPWEILVVIGAAILCGVWFVWRTSRWKDRAVFKLVGRVADLENRLALHEKEVDDKMQQTSP